MDRSLLFRWLAFQKKFSQLSYHISFDSSAPYTDKSIISTVNSFRSDSLYYCNEKQEEIIKDLLIRNIFKNNLIEPANITFTSGAQQALYYIFRLLNKKKNSLLLLEKYNYIGLDGLLNISGIRYITMPMIGELILEDIEIFFKKNKPDFFYIQSDNANPTSQTLTFDQRKRLIFLSRKYNVQIIEDSTYRYLRYSDSKLLPSLFELDSRVINVGSLSKIYFPGLRFGWIIAGKKIVSEINLFKRISVISASPIIYDLIIKLLSVNQDWVSKVIKVYQSRIKLLADLMRQNFPLIDFSLPVGGYMFWLKVKDNKLRRKIADFKTHGVIWTPGRLFDYKKEISQNYRLAVGVIDEHMIEKGIVTLAKNN